jgi:hypothetical protein
MTSALRIALTTLALAASAAAQAAPLRFDMVRPAALDGAPACAPAARATVTVVPRGPVEVMTVRAQGLPANTAFDFFVIQVPNAPFGLSWYQGDMTSNDQGVAVGRFIGRFNVETFIVAPNSAPAPVEHVSPIPDAEVNPPTGPVHTYHLGLWFNSADDAAAAGCPGAVTPFNGEHTAGIQILNTSQFGDLEGPLRQLGD